MWERLSSRDQTITVLERRPLVAGKPLSREIHAKLTALGPTPVRYKLWCTQIVTPLNVRGKELCSLPSPVQLVHGGERTMAQAPYP